MYTDKKFRREIDLGMGSWWYKYGLLVRNPSDT